MVSRQVCIIVGQFLESTILRLRCKNFFILNDYQIYILLLINLINYCKQQQKAIILPPRAQILSYELKMLKMELNQQWITSLLERFYYNVCKISIFQGNLKIINILTQAMSQKKQKPIQMHKILSTSMMYHQNICPYWVSDTQLNYMSQYDFISYDLDQDRIDLIQRPFPHKVIAVKYSALIGYRNVRIIYLYKQKTAYEWETPTYNFMIMPSVNFNEDFYSKKINIPYKKVWSIQNFIYYSDGQFVLFPILYEDHTIGVAYMGLSNNNTITYDLLYDFQDQYKQNRYKLSSLMMLNQNQNFNFSENKYVRIFQNTSIMFTRCNSQFIVISNNTIFLIKVCTNQKEFILLDKVSLDLQLLKQQSLINATVDCFTICLTKSYLVIRQDDGLLLYFVQNQSIILAQILQVNQICYQKGSKIGSISGSSTSHKFLITLVNQHVIYQLKVNEINNKIQYLNCIDLELQHVGSISKVIISPCARNAAIFTLEDEENPRGNDKRYQDVTNFSIFKIQLYTELGIPESSLYLKQIKYKTRNKRVNRLVIPKLYERLYSLTGSQVHTLQNHKISGVLLFDIHPHGFYMAVSQSFNIKIYSLQYNSMNLLYSLSLQNLKKVMYNPDGSCMIIFSSRKLKILDSYSFQPKYEITEKINSIIDVCFGAKHNIILILYDSGLIMERSFYDFQKIKTYRIFSHTHRKITSFKLDQRNENIMLLLEDGCIVTKLMNNLTSPDLCLSYPDDQKISQFYIDQKNHIVFTGTKNGILRIHNISIEKFSIKDYTEIFITQSEITAITSSTLQSYVYIGNIYGDITMVRYNPYLEGSLLAKSSKIINNIAPKVSPYFSFEFELISSTKFQGNSQQNALQDKLQTLIQKMQNHSSNYRKSIVTLYDEQKQKYLNIQSEESRSVYKDFDTKSKKLKLDLHFIMQKSAKQRKQLTDQYQNRLKQIFIEQEELSSQKKHILENQENIKNIEQIKNRQQLCNLKRQLSQEMETAEIFYKKQNFIQTLSDLEEDYKISDAEVLKTHNSAIADQLKSIKIKNMELNKVNSYLQTAKVNIMSRRVQQQILEHRIRQQLKMLSEVSGKQRLKISTLTRQLKSTEDLIHRIQNKVKNTPNNVISSDRADSDLCSYKIWMKSKAQEEVDQLSLYLKTLDDKLQDKSQQMVQLTTRMRKNIDKSIQFKDKLLNLKEKLKNLRYRSVVTHNCNINLQKNADCQFKSTESNCEIEANKAEKIAEMEKVNQKAISSQNRNLKIHTRKIKNYNKNNAELIHEYQNLKYQNKELQDKQIQFELQFEKIRSLIQERSKEKSQDTSKVHRRGKNSLLRGICSERSSTYQSKQTPFLKYIRQRSLKTKQNLKVINFNETACTTGFNSRFMRTMRSQRTSRII